MIPVSANAWRPATVFLSYSREDIAEVAALQQQLQIPHLPVHIICKQPGS